MDEFGGKLMEYYIWGFNDELSGRSRTESEDRLLNKSYKIGALDAIVGDDVEDNDMVAPNFSGIWKEATEMYQEKELSEMQLRKIFRVLTTLRNEGEITLD